MTAGRGWTGKISPEQYRSQKRLQMVSQKIEAGKVHKFCWAAARNNFVPDCHKLSQNQKKESHFWSGGVLNSSKEPAQKRQFVLFVINFCGSPCLSVVLLRNSGSAQLKSITYIWTLFSSSQAWSFFPLLLSTYPLSKQICYRHHEVFLIDMRLNELLHLLTWQWAI